MGVGVFRLHRRPLLPRWRCGRSLLALQSGFLLSFGSRDVDADGKLERLRMPERLLLYRGYGGTRTLSGGHVQQRHAPAQRDRLYVMHAWLLL